MKTMVYCCYNFSLQGLSLEDIEDLYRGKKAQKRDKTSTQPHPSIKDITKSPCSHTPE
jgi:hypothetical protein